MDYITDFKGFLWVLGAVIYMTFLWKPLKKIKPKEDYEDVNNYVSEWASNLYDDIYTWIGRISAVLMLIYGIYQIYVAFFVWSK